MNTAFNGIFSSSFQRVWQSVIKVLEMNALRGEGSPGHSDAQCVAAGSQLGSFWAFNQELKEWRGREWE